MRVAIYARVSTGKQDTENQAAQLREFAAKQDWTITQEFTDVVSGTKDERQRPQFKRMFESASKREFDFCLFWALDSSVGKACYPLSTTCNDWTATASRGARTRSSTSTPPGSSRTPSSRSWRPSRSRRTSADPNASVRDCSGPRPLVPSLGDRESAIGKASRVTLWRRSRNAA
jgi:hypothetical protein